MKLSYTEKFLIAVICLILIKILVSHSENFFAENSATQKNSRMTFTDFKAQYYSKALSNEVPQFSLEQAKISETPNGYLCTFDCGVVLGRMSINKRILSAKFLSLPNRSNSKPKTKKLQCY